MEHITSLKSRKKLARQLLSITSDITKYKVAALMMCFLFSRASLFEVIRPFPIAFYVSMSFSGISKILAIIIISIGNTVNTNFHETLRQLLTILLFEAFSYLLFKIGSYKETDFNRAVLIGVLIFVTGIMKGFIQGLHLYDLVVSVISAALVFSLSVLMAPAAESYKQIHYKIFFDWKTIFSKAVLLCAIVISLKGATILQCEIGYIIAGMTVLTLAWRKGSGSGACTGALFGMVLALYDLPTSLNIPGMMALGGAAAGLPVKSRTASVSLWTAIVIFFAGISVLEGRLISNYYEALASGILFLLIPNNVLNRLGNEFAGPGGKTEATENRDIGLIHGAANQLFVFGKALSRISGSVEETIMADIGEESSEARWMIEAVVEKVCNRCSLCERCWGTHFLKTYKLVEKSINEINTDGTDQTEIPTWFKNVCIKSDKFFESLLSAYSLYKAEKVWRAKLVDSRMLLSRQANIVSASVLTAARKLLDEQVRDHELENRLMEAAGNDGISVANFHYSSRPNKKPFLEVVLEARDRLKINEIDELVRETAQSSLVRVGENKRDMTGFTVVRYMKEPKFKTATGIARICRENSTASGDNFTFFVSGEGCHICAISDGTGSGKRAEEYSRAAIQMLENFLEDGIEVSQAVSLLNIYLNLKGENECLATMDICVIDLYNGDADFYKYDSPASFVKNSDEVSTVKIETDTKGGLDASHFTSATMAEGDFTIMVSDGISEAFPEEDGSTGLQLFIEGIETSNAQQMADEILGEALRRLESSHDDMTVLVTKLW